MSEQFQEIQIIVIRRSHPTVLPDPAEIVRLLSRRAPADVLFDRLGISTAGRMPAERGTRLRRGRRLRRWPVYGVLALLSAFVAVGALWMAFRP